MENKHKTKIILRGERILKYYEQHLSICSYWLVLTRTLSKVFVRGRTYSKVFVRGRTFSKTFVLHLVVIHIYRTDFNQRHFDLILSSRRTYLQKLEHSIPHSYPRKQVV